MSERVLFLRGTENTDLTFKVVRYQALQVLGGSDEDYCMIESESFAPYGGAKEWSKRKKHQQKDGLSYVLNRLFALEIMGRPWACGCPNERRNILLKMCQDAGQSLMDEGWSMHDVMDWLTEINQASHP